MSFFDDETGLDTSNPIELYRFFGSLASYTFTSSNREISFHAPSASLTEVYAPTPLSRNEIVLGDVTDRNELKIQCGVNNQLFQDYAFNIAPSDDLTIEIYRQNGPDGVVQLIFQGVVSGLAVQGLKGTITCPSIFTNYLDSEFPNIYYMSLCNHHLYDTGCGADRAAFTITSTVDSIIDTETIVINLAGTKPDGYFQAGEIFTATERRLILDHHGGTLILNWPFRSLGVGNAVFLAAGCLHDIQTCNDKFNVKDNFLGWPYIPYLNPYVVGIV